MSLARLLTAGKALTNLRDAPTPYRVRHDALLPKFGTGGNPFASAAETAGTAALPEPVVVPTKGASVGRSIWPWKWRGAKKEAATGVRQAPPTRLGPAPDVRPPLQGELSLANVKVVRNDLHESDVDLVFRPSGADRKSVV